TELVVFDQHPDLKTRMGVIADRLAAGEMTPIVADGTPSPGYTAERITIFHATGLSSVASRPDDDERITAHWMDLDDALAATSDLKTLVALWWLKARRHQRP